MSATVISCLEDALNYLSQYQGGKEDAPEVSFEGELSKISINVEGERYQSSLPSELARGLWEYQEAIYRAVAFTYYGVEDIRRLTAEQQRQFELVFRVEEGSTDMKASIKDFLTKLGEGFLTMDSKHKAYALVVIAVAMASGYAATTVVESQSKTKQEEVKASTQVAIEQEKTKQFDILAKAISEGTASAFKKASEDGAKAIVNRAPDAEKIKFGRTQLDRSDIEEFNQRATKGKSTADIVQEDFRVHGTYSRDASATRYVLARTDGTEFAVVVNHDDMTAADLEKIWAAARDRKAIALEVNLTSQRGTIKAAQIVKVF